MRGSFSGSRPNAAKVFLLRRGQSLDLRVSAGDERCVASAQPAPGGLVWYRLQAEPAHYENPAGSFRSPVAAIAYRAWICGRGASCRVKADAPGTFYISAGAPWFAKGNGTGRILAAEPLYELYPQVVQIVVRDDDSYLGYLSELYGTPFLLNPRVTPFGYQQADARLGADCAGLAIYGRRRLGKAVPYCGPFKIYDYLRALSGVLEPDEDGLYRGDSGEPLRVGKDGLEPGDILHFFAQVAVFYKDRGIVGMLDKDDLVIQAHGNGPGIFRIIDGGYYGRALRAYRWRDSY